MTDPVQSTIFRWDNLKQHQVWSTQRLESNVGQGGQGNSGLRCRCCCGCWRCCCFPDIYFIQLYRIWIWCLCIHQDKASSVTCGRQGHSNVETSISSGMSNSVRVVWVFLEMTSWGPSFWLASSCRFPVVPPNQVHPVDLGPCSRDSAVSLGSERQGRGDLCNCQFGAGTAMASPPKAALTEMYTVAKLGLNDADLWQFWVISFWWSNVLVDEIATLLFVPLWSFERHRGKVTLWWTGPRWYEIYGTSSNQ